MGERRIITRELVNQIKMPFDFRFQILNQGQSQIWIRPLQGVVPGLQTIRIEFIFEPKSAVTDIIEAMFFLDELNFSPLKVKRVTCNW